MTPYSSEIPLPPCMSRGALAMSSALPQLFRLMRLIASGASVCVSSRRPAARHVCRPSVISVCMRSEEHTSELQSLMRISYAVFCLKKKNQRWRDEGTHGQILDSTGGICGCKHMLIVSIRERQEQHFAPIHARSA